MIDTKRDISDLLPRLRDAALALKRCRNSENSDALSALVKQVAGRWGYSAFAEHWNQVIDALDAQYPNWRGYIPGVKRDERGAA
ncbi:MAG: hypothetical protein AAFX78_03355 [Cyanobacteria bacterium J06638_20]